MKLLSHFSYLKIIKLIIDLNLFVSTFFLYRLDLYYYNFLFLLFEIF